MRILLDPQDQTLALDFLRQASQANFVSRFGLYSLFRYCVNFLARIRSSIIEHFAKYWTSSLRSPSGRFAVEKRLGGERWSDKIGSSPTLAYVAAGSARFCKKERKPIFIRFFEGRFHSCLVLGRWNFGNGSVSSIDCCSMRRGNCLRRDTGWTMAGMYYSTHAERDQSYQHGGSERNVFGSSRLHLPRYRKRWPLFSPRRLQNGFF